MTKVLVAEDERPIRELLVDTLNDLGHDVLESVDGGETFQIAYQEVPNLILLDIMMPVMDGFEVLAKLRATPKTEAIPIIILTSISAAEREQEAFNSGVNHYISKPFDADALETTIRVALREARTEAGQDHGVDAGDESSGNSSGVSSKASAGSVGLISANALIDLEKEANLVKDTAFIGIGESLTTLEKQLGGGVRRGTVTLIVGATGTGKSVLCQTLAFAALQDGHGVAYFTPQFTPEQMATQMASIGLEISEDDEGGRFAVYPLPEPVFGEDSGPLLKNLAVDLNQIPSKYGLIVVDSITDLASTSQDYAVMAFFANCKRLCLNGRTLVVVAHSSAFSADLLGRASSVCETFMKFSTGKLRDRPVRKAELLKVDDIELDRNNTIAFNVEPDLGLQIIPYGQVKA